MKRHINFWLVMFLAISLALPIYSMAQTKLTLEDSTGNRISTPGIKSFAMGSDDNLVILLDQPFNFTDLIPDIFLASCTNCSITVAAGVTATSGATLSFNVQSSDTAAVISLVAASYEIALPNTLPITLSTSGSGAFSWGTGDTPPGSYLAVFQAQVGTGTRSQLPVMINVNPPETVSTPAVNGPAAGSVNQSYTFTVNTPSTVTPSGDPVQYFFDWGDGNNSGWVSGTSAQHIWGATGNYSVKVQARCATHTSVVSAWSGTVSITISTIPAYLITVNITPSGGGTVSVNGQPYTSSLTFSSGTVVNLSASAAQGYNFSSWSGDTTGTSSTTTITMNGAKTVTANFTPPPLSPPSGGSGSKTNPIPMNKGPNRGRVYYASTATNASSTPLAAHVKTWFVVDTSVVTDITVGNFSFRTQGFNNVDLIYTKVVQDKAGNDLSAEMSLTNNTGDTQDTVYGNKPYNFNTTRFLYSIESNGSFTPNVWVQFLQ